MLLLCCAGTGKTVYVKKQLQEGLPAHMSSMFMTFSAQTSANMTQVCCFILIASEWTQAGAVLTQEAREHDVSKIDFLFCVCL